MNFRAGITRLPRGAGRGFSLVELLLTVALIGLLLGAVVMNFSTLQRGARLDEGAQQLEALLRFARAQASATGHRVRIGFEEDVGEGLLVPLGNLVVTWEPDPLAQPDFFQPLPEAASYLSSILEAISIENVRPPADNSTDLAPTAPASLAEPDAGRDGVGEEPGLSSDANGNPGFGFAPITFYPDGSSDSAEITIASRDGDGEDSRRMILRLAGLTGTIRRRVVQMERPEAAVPFGAEDISEPTAAKEPAR